MYLHNILIFINIQHILLNNYALKKIVVEKYLVKFNTKCCICLSYYSIKYCLPVAQCLEPNFQKRILNKNSTTRVEIEKIVIQ